MNDNLFPIRLKETRLKKNLSLEELANKVDTSKTAISRYENGARSPKIGMVGKLATALNVDLSWLAGLDHPLSENNIIYIYDSLSISRQKKVYDYANHLLQEQQNEKVIHGNFNGKDIDVAGKVAAGLGTQNFDKTQPLFTIRMNKEDIPNDYDLALQVTGDSMGPTFEDGEIIFVKEQDEFQNGMIAAVEINEEAFIKKIYKEESRIRLVSLNRDTDENGNRLYPDFYADEKDELYLIGRVVL